MKTARGWGCLVGTRRGYKAETLGLGTSTRYRRIHDMEAYPSSVPPLFGSGLLFPRRPTLAVALLLVLAAFSQVPRLIHAIPTVTIKPHMAHIDPLVRTGVKITGITALVSRFTVNNYTDKTVTSIEYGWRIAAPSSCTDSTLPVRWQTATANVNIPPQGEVSVTPVDSLSALGSMRIVLQAEATHTPVVLVTIGIVPVTFADGSTWVDQEAVDRNTFDDNPIDKKEGCQLRTALSGK